MPSLPTAGQKPWDAQLNAYLLVGHDAAGNNLAAAPDANKEDKANKGQVNGYAALDGTGVVPDAQIPAAVARDAEVTAAISTHAGQADPHTVYQLKAARGAANGYASLDAGTKVPVAQLPAGTASGVASLDATGVVPDAQIPAAIARDSEVTSAIATEVTNRDAAIATHAAAADPHTVYQLKAAKAAVNGYASLDGTGKVPSAQLPTYPPTVPTVVNGQWLKGSGGAMVWSAITVADVSGAEATANKGVANGYASLDTGGTVPDAQIPAAIARDSEVTTAVSGKENTSAKGAANGYAPLDSGSKVPVANLPALGGAAFLGAYSGSTAYIDGDVVLYNGVLYMCVTPTTGSAPENWGV